MSKRIEDLDPNFRPVSLNGVELVFMDALKAPFSLSGFAWREKGGKLCRLPEHFLARISEGVRSLSWHTTGGLVRFRSDSPSIAVRAKLGSIYEIPRMPRLTSGGFDLYLGCGTERRFWKPAPPKPGEFRVEELPAEKLEPGVMRVWSLYLPLYGGVESLEIGVSPSSSLEAPASFSIAKPIAFYGSSITQGACASRPGNCYANILGRKLDAPILNFGFAGNAKGEDCVAELLSELDLSAFVLDYDHNAPSVEHLAATHERFFKILRARRPELPIVMVSKPDFKPGEEDAQRRAMIRKTWENAVAAGDGKAYFVDGESLFGLEDRDCCTVDGCHPEDLGFYRMALNLLPQLRRALGLA